MGRELDAEQLARFKCVDCGVDTSSINEYYMVNHDVWAKCGVDRNGGMLCIGCLETRIGRELKADDFLDAPVNQQGFFDQSIRLKSRLNA